MEREAAEVVAIWIRKGAQERESRMTSHFQPGQDITQMVMSFNAQERLAERQTLKNLGFDWLEF